MRSTLFLLVLVCCGFTYAQQFQPDRYGHISDPKFAALIKERGYQVVGVMDSVLDPFNERRLVLMIAEAFKNDQKVYLDWNGVEYADRDAVYRAFGKERPKPYNEEPDIRTYVDESDFDAATDALGMLDVPVSPGNPWYRLFYSNGKTGCITNGDTVVQPLYDEVDPHLHGGNICFSVKLNGLSGICDQQGRLAIAPAYTYIYPTWSGNREIAYIAERNGKEGVVSETGKVTIPFAYPKLVWQYEGRYFRVEQVLKEKLPDGRWFFHGALDTNGRELTPTIWSSVDRPKDSDLLFVSIKRWHNDKKVGAVDRSGRMVLDTVYTKYERYCEGVYFIERREPTSISTEMKTGLLDVHTGKFILPCEYRFDDLFVVPYVIFWKSYKSNSIYRDSTGSYGMMDGSARILFEPKYDFLFYSWRDKLILQAENGKYGIADSNRRPIVPMIYEKLSLVNDAMHCEYPRGTCVFRQDGKEGIMDLEQHVLAANQYDELKATPAGFVYRNGTYLGVIDLNGKQLITEQADVKHWKMKNGILYIMTPEGRFLRDFYGNTMPYSGRGF